MTVEGEIKGVDVAEQPHEPATVTVSDGSQYRLTARPFDGSGVEQWRAEPLKTAGGVEVGHIKSLEIEPPEMDEAEEREEPDGEFEVIDAIEEESVIGGEHAGSGATASLPRRRAKRDNRAETACKTPASEIRDRLRSGGTDEAMVREFKRLVTDEIRVRDSVGQRPDIPNVIRMLSGDEAVIDALWQRHETADTGDRVVGIALDMSGSVGAAAEDAKAAVGALAIGARAVDDRVVSVAFPQGRKESVLLTGPYERWDWQHLNATDPGGGTPMLPALKDLSRLTEPLGGRDTVLFVITDGRPANPDAVSDLVDTLRVHGTAVVGFGFGRVAEGILANIFGEDGYRHTDVEQLPRELLTAYLNQLETDAELKRI